jgi:hypothetical protein
MTMMRDLSAIMGRISATKLFCFEDAPRREAEPKLA